MKKFYIPNKLKHLGGAACWPTLDVLVVDDTPTLRQSLAAMLSDLGIGQVRQAVDGTSALHQIALKVPDIMFTDWIMPDISGLSLIEFMRRSPDSPYVEMPIVIVSALSKRSHVLQARDAGVNEFLVKPFHHNSVRTCLLAITQTRRHFIVSKDYVGPDRRRHDLPLDGKPERRAASVTTQPGRSDSSTSCSTARLRSTMAPRGTKTPV